MDFGIIGTSIWQQNLPLLEKLTINSVDRESVLTSLKEQLGLDELVYLSTCNRIEFIYITSNHEQPSAILHRLIDFFFSGGTDVNFFPNDFYTFSGKEGITHLYRTVSSLESLVVGETQITGQFKQAHEAARSAQLSGPALDRIMGDALKVARQVRRETEIGAGALSMASLAIEKIRQSFTKHENLKVALVGSGPMTHKLANYLKADLNASILFVNRTVEKISELAEKFGGEALSLNQFLTKPFEVDIIISATSSSEAIFDSAFVSRTKQMSKPLLAIDLAMPRDFATELDSDERITVVDIPSLKALSHENLKQKFTEVNRANLIVREAVNKFFSDRFEVSLKPIFYGSYKESIAHANKALHDLFTHRVKSLDEKEQKEVERMVTKLISESAFRPAREVANHLVDLGSKKNFDGLMRADNTVV